MHHKRSGQRLLLRARIHVVFYSAIAVLHHVRQSVEDVIVDGVSEHKIEKIKELLKSESYDFLRTNEHYKTEFLDIGDGLSVSKKLN